MTERLKAIPARILEWWNRFTSKQKTIIICITAGVVIALAILVTVLTRPQYELLANCESTKEASQITELLNGSGITYVVSDDGYQIKVLKDQISDANLLLGANNIPAAAYGICSGLKQSKGQMYSFLCQKMTVHCSLRMKNLLPALFWNWMGNLRRKMQRLWRSL